MDIRSWPCPPCGEIREFVQPPCSDGHTDDGGECPEWICVDCGTALVVGGLTAAPVVVHARVAA
jgi:acetone carboxylase gamma subunit